MAKEPYEYLIAMHGIYSEVSKIADTNLEVKGLLSLIETDYSNREKVLRKLTRFAFYDANAAVCNVAEKIHQEVSDRAVGYRQRVEEVASEYGLPLGDTSMIDWNKAMNTTAGVICFHYDNPFEVQKPDKCGGIEGDPNV